MWKRGKRKGQGSGIAPLPPKKSAGEEEEGTAPEKADEAPAGSLPAVQFPTALPLAAGSSPPVWYAVSAAEVGEIHLVAAPPVPCQDAAAAVTVPRPLLIVADGLGSRPLSQVGSDIVTRLVPCFLAGVEDESQALLDGESSSSSAEQIARDSQHYARGIVRFADAVLRDAGFRMGHPEEAFQCTMLLAVIGTERIFWLQVGDGALVWEKTDGALASLGDYSFREDPTATEVIRTAALKETLSCGLLPAAEVTGIAAFSDGAGERLIKRDGSKVATLLTILFRELREGNLSRLTLLDEFLRKRDIWTKTTRDDRSIALLARVTSRG